MTCIVAIIDYKGRGHIAGDVAYCRNNHALSGENVAVSTRSVKGEVRASRRCRTCARRASNLCNARKRAGRRQTGVLVSQLSAHGEVPIQHSLGQYTVTAEGQVFSYKGFERTELAPSTDSHGYMQVNLSLPHGRRRMVLIHRLVAQHFLAPGIPGQWQVNHIDGNKKNNSITNLEWSTPKQNVRHGWRTGLYKPRTGGASSTAKMTADQVRAIRARAEAGVSSRLLASEYGLDYSNVRLIINGKTWRQL